MNKGEASFAKVSSWAMVAVDPTKNIGVEQQLEDPAANIPDDRATNFAYFVNTNRLDIIKVRTIPHGPIKFTCLSLRSSLFAIFCLQQHCSTTTLF